MRQNDLSPCRETLLAKGWDEKNDEPARSARARVESIELANTNDERASPTPEERRASGIVPSVQVRKCS